MNTITAALSASAYHASRIVTAIPNPDPVQPPGTDSFTTIMGWAKWVALIILVLCLIGAGAMMGINSRRGEGSETLTWVMRILAGAIVVSAAGTIIGFVVS